MDRNDISSANPPQGASDSGPNLKSNKSQAPIHLERVATAAPEEGKLEDGTLSWSSESPDDPRNWPKWKKNAQILMVAFHSMVSTFVAAGITPAYETFAKEYNITMQEASYLTSIQVSAAPSFCVSSPGPYGTAWLTLVFHQILLLGLCPFFWKPISSVYGRYHVCLISVLGGFACNIGGARCTSYGSQMATRVLTAFLLSPPIGIGSGIVTELCEPGERAQKLGWWTLMTTVGTPAGPFFMGFVTKHIGVEWIFWIFAIINFVQFLVYLAIGAETLYIPGNESNGNSRNAITRTLVPRRINPRPIKLEEFIAPLYLARFPRVLIPACALAITFCYGNIAIIVEMPTAFGSKFGFDAQQVGLQYIGVIIGCVLGEQVGGPVSDWFINTLSQRRGQRRPADRLWVSYIGYGTIIAGLLTWGFQLQHATTWNVTPDVGAAIASFGNQVLVTTLTAFAVDNYKDLSTNVGVFVNICRQIFGFVRICLSFPVSQLTTIDRAILL